jgi:hypothetical protein
MIEKIQVQAQFLNAEKSQVASMGFKIRASIDNDLLQPIRIATVMGNRPERVFLGFPWDIGASLDIIKESNSKLSEILFVQNSQDMTVSINLADPKKVNDQIGSTLGLFQLLRKQKVSKETEEILLGYEKYLQALQDAAGKLNQ